MNAASVDGMVMRYALTVNVGWLSWTMGNRSQPCHAPR